MTPARHPHRCVPCIGALFAKFAPTWEDGPILSSLLDRDGIRVLGSVIPHEQSRRVHAVTYDPVRRYIGDFGSAAEAKEAVEQAVLQERDR